MFNDKEKLIIENLSDRFSYLRKMRSDTQEQKEQKGIKKPNRFHDMKDAYTRDSFRDGKGTVRNGLFTINIGTDERPVFSKHIENYKGVSSAYLPIVQFYWMFKLRPQEDDPKYVKLANLTVESKSLNDDLRYLSTSIELLNRYKKLYEEHNNIKDSTLEEQEKYINDYIYPLINKEIFKKSDPTYHFKINEDGFKLITESHCDAYFIALLSIIYTFNNRVGEESGIEGDMMAVPTRYILSKHGDYAQSFSDFYIKAIQQVYDFLVKHHLSLENDVGIKYMNGCFFGDSIGDIHYFYYDNDEFNVITFANVAESSKVKDFIDACSEIVGVKRQHGYGGNEYFKDFLIGLNFQGKTEFLRRLGKLCLFSIYGIKADKVVLDYGRLGYSISSVFKTYNIADWGVIKKKKGVNVSSITTGLSTNLRQKIAYFPLMLSIVCPLFHEGTKFTSWQTFSFEIDYKHKDVNFSITSNSKDEKYFESPIVEDDFELVNFFKDSKAVFTRYYPIIQAKTLSDKALKSGNYIFLYTSGDYKSYWDTVFIAYEQIDFFIDKYTQKPIVSIVQGTGVEPLNNLKYYIYFQELNFVTIIEDDRKSLESQMVYIFNGNTESNIKSFSELKKLVPNIDNLATPFPFSYTKSESEIVYEALKKLYTEKSKDGEVTKADYVRYLIREMYVDQPKDSKQMVEKAKKYLENR